MGRLQVLVVEDDALIGMLMSMMLQELGYEVAAVVANQDDAVRAARANPPDLMIVDDGLARGNGMDAVREILREVYVPHVFVTGDITRIQRSWPEAVAIRKPFQEHELVEAMDLALSRVSNAARAGRDCRVAE